MPIMGIEEVGGRKIIVANILPGMGKPYYLRSAGMMEGTYIRIAGMTRKAEPYMIKELQLEGTNISFDSMQVVGDAISQQEIDTLCNRMYQHALFLCRDDDPFGVVNPATETTEGQKEPLRDNAPPNDPQNVPQNVSQSKDRLAEAILDAIRVNPHVTRAEMAFQSGVSIKTISRKLKDMPFVRHVGSSKAGRWEIDF